MAPFELGLPKVVMGVNKTWANDLAAAVDELSSSRGCNCFSNLGNTVALHKYIGIPERRHIIPLIVKQ